MSEITVDHILQACAWAKTARESSQAINGQKRRYHQANWDCGTACCIWGAASILSGNGPATSGPSLKWAATDAQHALLAALLKSTRSTPDQVAAVAANANLRGADLRGADLRGADLSGADLSGADLSGADLSGAVISLGNRRCLIQ